MLHYVFAPLIVNNNRNWPTTTQIPTNFLYTPVNDTLLLLLFRHSAKSLDAQDELLATSFQMVTRLHLPHAIVVRLHVRKATLLSSHRKWRSPLVFEQ